MRWKKLECTLFQFYKFFEFDLEMTFYHHFSSHECLPFTQVWWMWMRCSKFDKGENFSNPMSFVLCLIHSSFFLLLRSSRSCALGHHLFVLHFCCNQLYMFVYIHHLKSSFSHSFPSNFITLNPPFLAIASMEISFSSLDTNNVSMQLEHNFNSISVDIGHLAKYNYVLE